jgi:hypothetical protein
MSDRTIPLSEDIALHNHSCKNLKSSLLYLTFRMVMLAYFMELIKSSRNMKFLLWISGGFP